MLSGEFQKGMNKMPYYYYWDWTYLLIIPGLILGLIAQAKVKSAYAQCSRIPAKCGLTASQMVADLLRRNGNTRVRVGHVSGELTDHYDPSKEVLNLSDGVYSSNSIAAMGIAAHEAGHAMQKLENYAPLNLRSAIVPAVNISSSLSTPMFILGLIFAWQPLVYIGIGLFAASTVFALVTLPVEFDASKRAIQMLSEGGYITGAEEERNVRKVLSAAPLYSVTDRYRTGIYPVDDKRRAWLDRVAFYAPGVQVLDYPGAKPENARPLPKPARTAEARP